jgi:hypothetical protein
MVGSSWFVKGSYFEACNCEAICPCRRVGEGQGGRSTYGHCDFALSWFVEEGRFGDLDLAGFNVVLAGTYNDDEPRAPWRVALYVDERASAAQQKALGDIFLGRVGGTPLRNFAAAIREVYAVKPARIQLEHEHGKQRIHVSESVEVAARDQVSSGERITCGIPGHDQPGIEWTADMRVDEGRLQFDETARAAFASDYDYRSDPA